MTLFIPWSQISPLMTREKKNSIEKRRMVDLSFPLGYSVNAGILKGYYQEKQCSFKLLSILDAAKRITVLERNCNMWSVDLARAYRHLRTCPLSIPLLGIKVDNEIYFDLAPPFGCRSSVLACASTTSAIVHLMKMAGFFLTICYLEDFIGIEQKFETACSAYIYRNEFLNKLDLKVSKKEMY